MANPNPDQTHLVRQKARWQHLPTIAVRIPECFVDRALTLIQQWDRGEGVEQNSSLDLSQLSIEQLIELQSQIVSIVAEKRAALIDRRLENAIAFLAGQCDGARENDGIGFNGCDASYGHWLAGRTLTQRHAKQALEMLQKYRKTQLEPNGYTLPTWDAIEHQYPETIQPMISVAGEEPSKPEKRIELVGSKIAVYHPYDRSGEFQRLAKSIENYDFEGKDKSWRYPASQVLEILKVFQVYDLEISEEVLGEAKLQEGREIAAEQAKEAEALKSAEYLVSLIAQANLDAPLANGWNLFPHQREAAEWLLAHSTGGIYRGGILADHMGLGKTLSALSAAKAMVAVHSAPVFVICPASLKDNWLIEAAKVGVAIEVYSWAKLPEPLETQKYILICDEAHYAQDSRSKRSQRMMELAQSENCLAAWLLTGTPIKNGRPINLMPLLMAVQHPLVEDKLRYQKRYCNAHHKSVGRGRDVWDVSGAAHLDELQQKTGDVILRRTKKDCLHLPEKIRALKPVDLDSSVQKNYDQQIKALVQQYRDRAKAGEVDPDAEALVTLNILRKIGSQFKTDAAIAVAQEILEQGEQVVIFTEFLESAKAIHAALGGELLTGETPNEQRQGMVDRFQSGESKVFIGTIRAGGVGLTLTKASNVLLVDRPWTPGEMEQAEDRCHRIGQNATVTAFWLQLGQIDAAIDGLIQQKQDRIELVLKGKRKTLRGVQSAKELAKELLAIL